ncbi:MAG: class I SAM-dependent methyltransferase [Phycisphaerae bacterium]|jgi:SAM-dependent methyltransferase|nr:class I SAM-dependent methyltransferase [Phycisphaerae bacterium]HOO17394.1 class I SAM-dependent methyltransferase [Phycisphaerae bacterium]HPC21553.1 class I SAM-dependent methyltransferase [Phycisphaerae bacterium]HRS26893.1 class I SAM-dependent methyltransferase [Phycisphaerae bacterium]HRT41493.1 class I SAM-dependent methyltransferase [Phycisphaerae bacterium]
MTTLQQRLGRPARRWLRHFYYNPRLSFLTRVLQPAGKHEQQSYWDAALSGHMVDYLGDTRAVIQSNAIVVGVLRAYGPPLRRVLDVGCAGGTLAYDLPADVDYLGIDISAVAIADALQRRRQRAARPGRTEFQHSSIADFQFDAGSEFDAIVLSEVVYYLTPQVALEQTLRYSAALSPGGVLVVSMKQDPKSLLIFRQMERALVWLGGVLYQPKSVIDFRVRPNGKSPAFLVGAFRPKS